MCRARHESNRINLNNKMDATHESPLLLRDPPSVHGWTREQCPNCSKSVMFYCPFCCILMRPPSRASPAPQPKTEAVAETDSNNAIGTEIAVPRASAPAASPARSASSPMPSPFPPPLTLPLEVAVVFKDSPQKSTGLHAKCLAPASVRLFAFPEDLQPPQIGPTAATTAAATDGSNTHSVFDAADTVLGYPSDDAVPLDSLPRDHLRRLKRIVLIDSAWKKSRAIAEHASLRGLPRVKLKLPPPRSLFWRYHGAGAGCVSTIEALRCFMLECNAIARDWRRGDTAASRGSGCTDAATALPWPHCTDEQAEQLLFLFALQRQLIVHRHEAAARQKAAQGSGADTAEGKGSGGEEGSGGGGGATTLQVLLPMDERAKRRRLEHRAAAARGQLRK